MNARLYTYILEFKKGVWIDHMQQQKVRKQVARAIYVAIDLDSKLSLECKV